MHNYFVRFDADIIGDTCGGEIVYIAPSSKREVVKAIRALRRRRFWLYGSLVVAILSYAVWALDLFDPPRAVASLAIVIMVLGIGSAVVAGLGIGAYKKPVEDAVKNGNALKVGVIARWEYRFGTIEQGVNASGDGLFDYARGRRLALKELRAQVFGQETRVEK